MDVKKIVIVISIAFVLFASVLGGVYFYISRTLTSEKVRDLIVESLNSAFPTAQVHVGEVDFQFGTSIKFVISRIEVKKETPVFSLADTRLRIPVWAILKGGGVVEVEVSSPKINWIQTEQGNNWQDAMAMKSTETAQTAQTMASPSNTILALPAFLQASRLNLKMRDSVISYSLGQNQKGEIVVSKFLVKELGFENPAAFEIDTKLYIEQDNQESFSAKTLLIGELDFQRFLSQEILAGLMVVTISEIRSTKFNEISFPDVRADIRTEVSSAGAVKGNLKATFLNSSIAFNFEHIDAATHLNQINALVLVNDLLQIGAVNIDGLNAAKSTLSLGGEFRLNKTGINPDLNFSLSPGIAYSLKKSIPLQTQFKGTMVGNKLAANVSANIFQGQVQNDLTIELPINQEFDIARVPPLIVQSNFSNLNITRSDLDALMAQSKNSPVNEQEEGGEEKPLILVPLNWTFSIENAQILAQKMSGQGKLTLNNNGAAKFDSELLLGTGKIKKNLAMNFMPQPKGTISVVVENLNGEIANAVIPTGVGRVRGDVDLKLNGEFVQDKALAYNMNFDARVTDGRIDNIDPSLWLKDLLQGLGDLAPKAKELASRVKIEPDFSELSAQGHASAQKISFKKLIFKGIKDKFELNGSGDLSMDSTKQSRFDIQYRDHDGNLSAFLKKEIGSEILPLQLEGKGLDLKPDIEFTIKKLSKVFVKNKGKKLQEKGLKKAAEKLLNEEDGKKINKLIQGIFQ